MRRGSSFFYLIKEGVRSIGANYMMSIAAIGALTSCLIMIGSSVLFTMNVQNFVDYVENQNEVVVILEDNMDLYQIETIQTELEEHENIIEVDFVSKEEGLQSWVDSIGDDGTLMDLLQRENPLPHLFVLTLENLGDITETVIDVRSMPGVEEVNAPMEVASTVSTLKQAVDVVATAIILILALVSLVVVTNTIRITVFNRRKEINLMKYVGATNTFIRMPFFVEGVVMGILSATLAFAILFGVYTVLLDFSSDPTGGWISLMSGTLVPFEDVAINLYIGFLAAGVGIGTVGSMAFLGRYLRV